MAGIHVTWNDYIKAIAANPCGADADWSDAERIAWDRALDGEEVSDVPAPLYTQAQAEWVQEQLEAANQRAAEYRRAAKVVSKRFRPIVWLDPAQQEEYEALLAEARRFAHAPTIRDELRPIAIEKHNVVEVTSTNKAMKKAGAEVGDRLVVFWTQMRQYGYYGAQSLKIGAIRLSDGAKIWATHARVKVVGRYAEIPEASEKRNRPEMVPCALRVDRTSRSGKAVLVSTDFDTAWLPVSQIEISDGVVIRMAEWLVAKKFPSGLGGVAEMDADGIDRATIGRVTTG